jgi:hypothetical protein
VTKITLEEARRRRANAKKPSAKAAKALGMYHEYYERQRAKGSRNRDAIAEIVAEEDVSVAEAGRRIGLSQQGASRHWRIICEELGDQAR